MAKCAFCHCSLEENQGSIIPGEAMAYAIGQGYSPDMSPSWPAMKETAVKAITDYEADCSDAALAASWKRQLTLPGRRFRLCDSCFSTLFRFLPADPGKIPRAAPQYAPSNGAALGYIVPINTSIWAIFASYAALVGMALFPIALISLILGIVALVDVKKHPEKGGQGRAIFAIIVGIASPLFWMLFFTVLVRM